MNNHIKEDNSFWESFELISSYTRANAIEDGILIAVDEKTSREAGITHSIAITREVWDKYVAWEESDSQRQTYQDEEGRIWDVLWMLSLEIKRVSSRDINKLQFSLYVIPRKSGSRARKARLIRLWADIHSGDNGEPVITISDNEYLY